MILAPTNYPLGSFYQRHGSSIARGVSPRGVDLVRAADEAAFGQAIERLHGYDAVVIDTPGCYGEVLIQSALRADLVVLPCKVHTFDASQVVRTIFNLERHADETRLPMGQHCVLFNEYDSLDRNTRPLREVVAYLDSERVPVCANALYSRVTYRQMASSHGTLSDERQGRAGPQGSLQRRPSRTRASRRQPGRGDCERDRRVDGEKLGRLPCPRTRSGPSVGPHRARRR